MRILLGVPEHISMDSFSSKSSYIVPVQTYEQFDYKIDDNYDQLVLHVELFANRYPFEWMCRVKEHHPNAKVWIILSETTYDSIMNDVICRLATDFEFSIIPQGLHHDHLVSAVSRALFGGPEPESKQGKVIAVMSASPHDGATTVALNCALDLARCSELHVGLLDLNLWNPALKDIINIPVKGKDLLSLRPKLVSKSLKRGELKEHAITHPNFKNLYMLFGTSRRDTAPDISMNQINKLLDVAREAFHVTFVDVHTLPNNAATVCAIKNADERWLITQPVYTSFKTSWPDWYECFWRHCGLSTDDFKLIANCLDPDGKIGVKAIEASTGIAALGSISLVPDRLGLRAVNDGVPLLLQDNHGVFGQEIRSLISRLGSEFGVSVFESNVTKKDAWFKRSFKKLLG